ncbi:MAG: acetolactate synthase small subunit [Spirochaetia bacterium]|jgi:acetolactate synthase-1/3 small subunit|nr:acetolactate synthase small subunit [Candidatus Omnitrophota bacterium]MDD3981789.1 acetolactate synthase small subunit [Spirochaetales bacterium]MDX9784474.1 acetolactate synthase small subunit [Spirochaetia bacterium]
MTHTVSLLVENHEGVLSRIARLFDGRGYRLESLTTKPTDDYDTNRITLVVSGAHNALEKVEKQLEKFIDVIHLEVRYETATA